MFTAVVEEEGRRTRIYQTQGLVVDTKMTPPLDVFICHSSSLCFKGDTMMMLQELGSLEPSYVY